MCKVFSTNMLFLDVSMLMERDIHGNLPSRD